MGDLVLVTGGSGFVGGWAIVELLKRGYDVRTTVRDVAKADAVREAVATEIDPGERLTFAAADLNADAGWAEAMAGCRYVLHIASPMGNAGNKDMVETAVDGTRRVLQAAIDAGVRRVVMTSSTAACTPAKPQERAITEADWTDPNQQGLSEYRKSKAVAERAAWDLMSGKATEFVTILPGAIFGPVLAPSQEGSVSIIRRLLQGQPPAMPRLGFNITDVRELAALHVNAIETPVAAGQRFIALGESLWYPEIADALRSLGDKAAKVPTNTLPDAAFKALALVNAQMKDLLPLLGRTQKFSADNARQLLGYAPRPAAKTVADCGASLAV